MTKRFGFTLAEVLITLGIIGVVAAMTMPTLINQTNGAQYKAAYKKALSAISQGVTLNVALDDISFADTIAGTEGVTTAPTNGTSVASLLASRMNVVKAAGTAGYTFPSTVKGTLKCTSTLISAAKDGDPCYQKTENTVLENQNITPDTFLFFNDSSMIAFQASTTFACTQTSQATNGNKECFAVIDVNGPKGPNKEVVCDGGTSGDTCKVKSPTDIYPVVLYDQTILPASDAGKAVLYGK